MYDKIGFTQEHKDIFISRISSVVQFHLVLLGSIFILYTIKKLTHNEFSLRLISQNLFYYFFSPQTNCCKKSQRLHTHIHKYTKWYERVPNCRSVLWVLICVLNYIEKVKLFSIPNIYLCSIAYTRLSSTHV